jgi:hypothetical protein
MTLHKPHAGDGYTYLTRQVAAGDEGRSPGQELTDYYTASGNPPGRWLGSGAADLQVTGRVREDQMRSLFGRGLHPDAEEIVALETAAGTSPEAAERAVKLGRAFPRYQPLPLRAERVAARLSDWEREQGRPPAPVVRSTIEAQEARKDRRAVAGYDLVVTPVKVRLTAVGTRLELNEGGGRGRAPRSTYLPEPASPTQDALALLASWVASETGPSLDRPADQRRP